MSKYVIDASALVALIAGEKGSDVVKKHLNDAMMSTVNISECIESCLKKGATFNEADSIVESLIDEQVDFTREHAKLAAKLKRETKKYGLSLGDRACLSLAMSKKLPVLTADKVWEKLDVAVKVNVIR